MRPSPQFPVDLVTFTEEIRIEKHFLFSGCGYHDSLDMKLSMPKYLVIITEWNYFCF